MAGANYIYLEWLGNGEAPALNGLVSHVESVFGVPVRRGRLRGGPPDAYDPKRQQYLSTRILRWMLDHVPADARKVIALTDHDLFITVLTYVFGEAQLGGTGAVVSTARLRINSSGLRVDEDVFHERLLKECVHELGHTFGLVHCRTRRCVMSRSNTINDVDAKSVVLCSTCRSILRELRLKETHP